MVAHRILLGSLAVGLVLFSALPAGGLGGVGASSKIDGDLLRVLDSAAPDATVGVIVDTVGTGAEGAALARALGIDVGWTYDIIDAFSARVPASGVHALAAQPSVLKVWHDEPVVALMDVSARDVQAPAAWNAGYNGAGITVAVIDTGIDVLDPAFPSGTIVRCVALVGGVAVPECDDTDGHGTHVAGTVASRSTSLRGIAWGANLAAVRVLHAGGAGLSSDVIAGINWVRNFADVVTPPIRVATMSLGPVSPGCGNGMDPGARAADNLVAAGIAFSVAAGNSGHSSCTVDSYASAFNVVTVGAVSDGGTANPYDDTIASFSSGGPTLDGRIKPELMAPGVSITSSYIGPFTSTLSGTSMATPHVGGAMAVLLQQDGSLSPADLKMRLTSTALHPTAAPSLPDNDWGWGLLNVCSGALLAGCQT